VESKQSSAVSLPVSDALCQALWAAMHDDDDLVSDYIELAVIHALTHLVRECSASWYTPERWARIHEYLEMARRTAKTTEEEIVRRFYTYAEPPF
jgi:hypothetical protein